MARIRVRGIGRRRPRLKPKTLLTVVIAVALVVAVWLKRDDLAAVVDALMQGALVPLAVGACFELGRATFHALAYTRSFAVIGGRVPLRATLPAWFKAVFVNTVLPSGGTSGLACVIDVARRRGVAVGSATTGTLFTQTCYYLAMFLAILLGFWVMSQAGTLTLRDVAVGSVIGFAALAFVSLLALGHLAPGRLQRGLRAVERFVARACKKLPFVKKAPAPWADNLVHSYSAAATSLVRNPLRSFTVFVSMVVAMGCDTLSFVSCGYAFGIEQADALFGAYVTALVCNSVIVLPGGAGLVEGFSAAVLAGYGYPLAQALSVVLCYRAFMYWIPMLLGGVMMRLTGGQGGAETRAGEDKQPVLVRLAAFFRSEAGIRCTVCATLMLAAACTAFASSVMGTDMAMEQVVSNFVLGWEPFDPMCMRVCGALVLACVPGVFLRDAGNWLASVASVLALGVSCALAAHGAATVLLCLLSLAALVTSNEAFAHHPYQLHFLRLCDRLGIRRRKDSLKV